MELLKSMQHDASGGIENRQTCGASKEIFSLLIPNFGCKNLPRILAIDEEMGWQSRGCADRISLFLEGGREGSLAS
ncbi:hypothetical protein ACLOJK_041673 [Asimina triloba]